MTPDRGRLGPGIARWAGVIAGSVALFALACALAPHAPLDPTSGLAAALAAYAIGFGAVCAMTVASAVAIPLLPARALAIAAPIALAIAGLAWVGVPASPPAVAAALAALVIALLLSGGGIAGAVIGGRIERPGHLAVVAVASSLADLWSVLVPGAPTAMIASDAPRLSALALAFPVIGTEDVAPLLGVGDVVFAALYVAAARRHSLGVARTGAALAVGFAVTGVAVVALERAIPALPFLGAAVLVAHPRARLPPPEERRTAAIGLALLALLGAVLVVLLTR